MSELSDASVALLQTIYRTHPNLPTEFTIKEKLQLFRDLFNDEIMKNRKENEMISDQDYGKLVLKHKTLATAYGHTFNTLVKEPTSKFEDAQLIMKHAIEIQYKRKPIENEIPQVYRTKKK